MKSQMSSSAVASVVDVLAVDRRDEGAVDELDDLVGEVVADVLAVLDLRHQLRASGMVLKQFQQHLGRRHEIGCRAVEEAVELAVPRHKANLAHVPGTLQHGQVGGAIAEANRTGTGSARAQGVGWRWTQVLPGRESRQPAHIRGPPTTTGVLGGPPIVPGQLLISARARIEMPSTTATGSSAARRDRCGAVRATSRSAGAGPVTVPIVAAARPRSRKRP